MEKEGSIEHILGTCEVCGQGCCNCKSCIEGKGRENICTQCSIKEEREGKRNDQRI
jgi:hypothetical protein